MNEHIQHHVIKEKIIFSHHKYKKNNFRMMKFIFRSIGSKVMLIPKSFFFKKREYITEFR